MARREGLFVLFGGALLLIVTSVVIYLLLAACGARPLFGGWLPSFCPTVAAAGGGESGLRDAAARARALEDEIRRLEFELIEASRCPEPGPVGPRLARPAGPPPFLPGLIGEPPVIAAPAVPPAVPPSEPASLDAERWEEQDISILEGCWQLDSNYSTINAQTGQRRSVTDWQLCLDSNGTGEQTMVYEDGTQCRGPAQGRFDPTGQLILTDTSRIQCADGAFIYERVTTCDRTADGTAACVAVQPGRDTRSAIRLRR